METCICSIPQQKENYSNDSEELFYGITESAHSYDLVHLLFHSLKTSTERDFWHYRNNIMSNLDRVYVLIRVNTKCGYLKSAENSKWEILSWCLLSLPNHGTYEIELFHSLQPRKGYGRKLIEYLRKKFSDHDFYVQPTEDFMIDDSIFFWKKVLPCWKELNPENRFFSIGTKDYFTSSGVINKYSDELIWEPVDISFILDKLEIPDDLSKMVLKYDNSIDCAIERIKTGTRKHYGFDIVSRGIIHSKDYSEAINEHLNLDNIEKLLDEFVTMFWPAPIWNGSYDLKHRVEALRKNRYYCSNGDFIMASLLLGYSIIPFRINANIKLDSYPEDQFKEILMKNDN